MWAYQLNFFFLLAIVIGGLIYIFKGEVFRDNIWGKLLGLAIVAPLFFGGVIPAYNEMMQYSTDTMAESSEAKEQDEQAMLLAEKEYYQSINGPKATLETDEEYNIRKYDFKPKSQTISWDEAGDCVGQTVTVEGVVVESTYYQFDGGIDNGGSAIFYLNLGNAFPDTNRFTAIIWYEDILNGSVDDTFTLPSATEGYTVQITGTVVDYEGVPEIEISNTNQIRIASSLGEYLFGD